MSSGRQQEPKDSKSPEYQVDSATFRGGAVRVEQFPDDGLPQVAVAGRSNVGKSSLLNYLLARKSLVKTSQKPGKTREVNFFLVNQAFYLVDIPGFGYARAAGQVKKRMEEVIRLYFTRSNALKGVVYLIDCRVAQSAVDQEALSWLVEIEQPVLPILTKTDKLSRNELQTAVSRVQVFHGFPEPPLLTSAAKRRGREELWEQIRLLLDADMDSPD